MTFLNGGEHTDYTGKEEAETAFSLIARELWPIHAEKPRAAWCMCRTSFYLYKLIYTDMTPPKLWPKIWRGVGSIITQSTPQ